MMKATSGRFFNLQCRMYGRGMYDPTELGDLKKNRRP